MKKENALCGLLLFTLLPVSAQKKLPTVKAPHILTSVKALETNYTDTVICIDVMSNVDYTVSTSESWINEVSQNIEDNANAKSNALYLSIAGNPAKTEPSRSAVVTIQDADKTITKQLSVKQTADPSLVYRNPVVNRSLPDPTIIKAHNGNFYLYATEDIRNTPIFRSKDLIKWEQVGTAFTDATRPTFEKNGGLWAPDINYINGKYVLYYSMSVWGGGETCGIGVAISNGPEGPFVDKGKLFRSNEIGVHNSIDQFFISDNGKNYLVWGSFNGIYAIELTEDGLAIQPGAVKQQIAGTAFEASYIHKRNGYYYFFGSWGSCCEGLKSTYKTVYGRSTSLFGPYVNKQGGSMMDNNYDVLIQGNDFFKGVGHNAEIVTDNDGQDWIMYHGYSVKNYNGRVLMLDKVQWKNDWPYVEGNAPSSEAIKPVF